MLLINHIVNTTGIPQVYTPFCIIVTLTRKDLMMTI